MRKYFLQTKRIGFSYWQDDDLLLMNELYNDKEVTRYISQNGFSQQDIINRLNLEISNYKSYGIQYYPIFHLETHELIGACGLRPHADTYELGFHLKKKYWHQGYGYEAASTIIDYSFHTMNIKELIAGHHPLNKASQHLLIKLGFQYTGDQYYSPTGLYHPTYILKNEFIH